MKQLIELYNLSDLLNNTINELKSKSAKSIHFDDRKTIGIFNLNTLMKYTFCKQFFQKRKK